MQNASQQNEKNFQKKFRCRTNGKFYKKKTQLEIKKLIIKQKLNKKVLNFALKINSFKHIQRKIDG